VQRLPEGVRIGIVTFADQVDTAVLPTTDKARVLRGLQQFRIQQQTALGPGLLAALRMIQPAAEIDPKYDTFERIQHAADPQPFYMRGIPPPRYQPKHDPNRAPVDPATLIVLVSDGHGTIGISAIMAAELVAHHGIRVYTVGVGTPYGGMAKAAGLDPVHADFQAETLELVAQITGGKYTEADSLDDLEAIYQDLSQGKIRARTEVEIGALFAAAAALMLLAGGTLSLRWHGSFV
jgi:Ca-activated chloride channel family protein